MELEILGQMTNFAQFRLLPSVRTRITDHGTMQKDRDKKRKICHWLQHQT